MKNLTAGLMIAAIAGAAPMASAAPMSLQLTPGNMLAQTHSRALIISTTATFRQISGTLNIGPATGSCAIDVTFVVLSLQLPNAVLRSQTMSASFLDPAQYPLEHYVATCKGQNLVGNLTMHGQTHPFTMTLTYARDGDQVTAVHAEGTLNRHDWGINGLPLVASKMIRITNDISLTAAPPKPLS